MKFTKLLVIFLALSMLLVSCNGVGNGAVTTEPDGTTVEPDVSTIEPDATTEAPDSSAIPPETTLPPIDWTPPEPSDATEYIKCGDELIDIFTVKGTKLPGYNFDPIWYYPLTGVERLENIYSNEYWFIIQFTSTDYAEQERFWYDQDYRPDFHHVSMRGTIDKIYYAGGACDLKEGQSVDLALLYWLRESMDGCLYIYGYTSFTAILRKGYSYIVVGAYDKDAGAYIAGPDTFELSSDEDRDNFYSKIGLTEDDEDYGYYVIGYTKHMRDDILRAFPPVEPTKIED